MDPSIIAGPLTIVNWPGGVRTCIEVPPLALRLTEAASNSTRVACEGGAWAIRQTGTATTAIVAVRHREKHDLGASGPRCVVITATRVRCAAARPARATARDRSASRRQPGGRRRAAVPGCGAGAPAR